MSIKVWSYLQEYEEEREEILQLVDKVFSSGTLILGEEVLNFEKEFSAYCECNFGTGVNSATDALFLALKSLGIGEGDEVITVSNTAVPTVSAIVASGATPVFVDVDPNTFLMDCDLIDAKITEHTKCILPVHLFGQCVDMERVNKIAIKHNLSVIEDCSQSHGATFKGKKCGSFSDLSVFSFYPTKILGTYGDGGIILTHNEKLQEKTKKLRFYGMSKSYYAQEQGYNSRLDEVHAAILRFKLKKIDERISRRNEIAKLYNSTIYLKDLILPQLNINSSHSYYLFVVKCAYREELMDYLKINDIFVNISYPWPIHLMEAYEKFGYTEGTLPITEKLSKEIFSLPMYPSLTDEEVLHICKVLNEFKLAK